MRLFAFHKVYWPGGRCLSMQFLGVDEAGHLCANERLEGERHSVAWVGGVCVLLPEGAVPQSGESISLLVNRENEAESALCLWRPVGLPVSGSADTPVTVWLRVV